jgi:hypothetical protein
MAPRVCPCQQVNCTLIARPGLWAAADRRALPMLSGVSRGYIVERVTRIELALSAWEVCGAAALPPGDSATCEDLYAWTASYRDYP